EDAMGVASRREFLRASSALALSAAVPADLFAQAAAAPTPASATWDAGGGRHLLPPASGPGQLIKASLNAPLPAAPSPRPRESPAPGRMGDTRGEHWHFHAGDLAPGRSYRLALAGKNGAALCEPWELATFPAPDERPERFRVLFVSCAGGHEALKFLPPAVRN